MREVIEAFTDQRMLTVTQDSVEVTHEVLLREWPRLQGWIQDNKDGLVAHRRLTSAAQVWVDSDRDQSALLGAGRLEVFGQWARTDDHERDLNNLEREYLAASTAHHHELAEAERQRRRKLHRLNATLAVIAVIAVVAALGAVGAGVYANNQRHSAELSRNEALSRQVALESRLMRADSPELASQLALAAYRIFPTTEATTALMDATAVGTPTRLVHSPGSMGVAISPDGSSLVTSTADGIARIYQLIDEGAPVLTAEFDSGSERHVSFAVAFTPDSSLVALGGSDGIELWSVNGAEPEFVTALDTEGASIHAAVVSPEGTVLAAGTPDGGVLRWDISNPQQPISLPPVEVDDPLSVAASAIAYSPNGQLMATSAADSQVKLWAVSDAASQPSEVASLLLDGDGAIVAMGIAISPDGRFLAAATSATDVQRWDISDLDAPLVLESFTGFDSWVNDVAFTRDGRHLAVGSSDQTAQIRNWSDGAIVSSFQTPGLVTSVAFTPDEQTLIAGASDGIARLWQVPGPVVEGITGVVFQMRYNNERDRMIVTAGRGDRAVHVFDVSDPSKPTRLSRVEVDEHSASGDVSADGEFLAAGTLEGDILLFDLGDGHAPRQVGQLSNNGDSLIPSLAVAPDKSLVAAPSYAGAYVFVWDVRDPEAPQELPDLDLGGGHGEMIDFSPNGKLLAAGSSASEFKLWRVIDTTNFEPARGDFGTFSGSVPAVKFNHDSTMLAVAGGGGDNIIRLYDVEDPDDVTILATLTGPRSEVTSLDFSPDGRALSVTAGENIWLWDVTEPSEATVIGTPAAYEGRVNDAVFIGDGSRIAASGWSHHVKVWSTDPESAAAEICRQRGTPISSDEWDQYVEGAEQFELCE